MKSLTSTLTIGVSIAIGLIIAAVFIGCSQEEPVYQIEVKNRLPAPASVSLDGMREKELDAGETLQFYNVAEGTHLLRAEASGFDPIEEIIQVNRDIIWIIEEGQ